MPSRCFLSPYVRFHDSYPLGPPRLYGVGTHGGRDNGRLRIGQCHSDTGTGDNGDAGAFDDVEDVEPARSVVTGLGVGTQLDTVYVEEHLREITEDVFAPAQPRPYRSRYRYKVGRDPAAVALPVEVWKARSTCTGRWAP